MKHGIRLNGKLILLNWQPDENTQPTNQTKFKLLFDNNAIYVFVKSFVNPNEIVNRLTRRDKLDGDAIYIGIDSNNDKINSFMFGLIFCWNSNRCVCE